MGTTSEADWIKYGLGKTEAPEEEHLLDKHNSRESHLNELFAEDQSFSSKPWWKTNFFISEPILFGAWDGVFTSCMINIFGVIIFLRSGWIVGEAGIGNSIFIICTAILVIIASVFAGIGICERCPVQSGGVYFLLSHVLGARIGGAIGLVYCFGQAVSAALHSIGFGEAIGRLLPVQNVWIERGLALTILVILVGINIAGVIWVVKLQFILLLILLLAALDFAVGSFITTSPENGVDGYYSNNFWNNSKPSYTDDNNWFTVFGVFFPTMTGVFAGINMSGDLRNPSHDIPTGTLSALGTSAFLYLSFILILGATCRRQALLTDYLIAEKVSALGLLFLSGLYISSISACLATLYGTPRVLQSIAKERVIPFLKVLERGTGPNQVPVVGLVVITSLTIIFVLIGEINTLAPLVTMPFLLTYSFINYAYFSLAMTFDAETKARIKAENSSLDRTSKLNYGATEYADLDKLFPERNNLKQKAYTQSTSSPTSSLLSSPEDHSSVLSEGERAVNNVESAASNESLSDFSKMLEKDSARFLEIGHKSHNWYSMFCNRWISLIGAVINILIMFLVHWMYALIHLIVVMIIYIYIGQANPGVPLGVAKFKLFSSIKNLFLIIIGRKPAENDQIIVNHLHPGVKILAAQLTGDNEDYATRERYHRSEVIANNKPDALNDK